ncbi:MAG: quinone-dependent dihydroorotate dehydrogenase [Rhizobiaceae bacterium]
MTSLYESFGRPFLFRVDAERAHQLSIAALKAGVHPKLKAECDKRLEVKIAGLTFPNPLGMAAGYDKDAEVPDALLSMGFGHVETGTVTPRPQPGNPKPRIFRLVRDDAVINRFGFNSVGHDAAKARLLARKQRGIVGANIGANKDSEDFAADYVIGIHAFDGIANYMTANISSPNTPGLRGLQLADPLADLLSRIGEAREASGSTCPVFLKIAPDLDEAEMDAIVKALDGSGFDGLIVSNTTLSREGLKSSNRDETGGLSGAPLFKRSTIVLARMRQRLGPDFPLIGVGGVSGAKTAFSKIEAGADLVQLYTGMIYRGPGLPGSVMRGLSNILDREEMASISEAKGRLTEEWAKCAVV